MSKLNGSKSNAAIFHWQKPYKRTNSIPKREAYSMLADGAAVSLGYSAWRSAHAAVPLAHLIHGPLTRRSRLDVLTGGPVAQRRRLIITYGGPLTQRSPLITTYVGPLTRRSPLVTTPMAVP